MKQAAQLLPAKQWTEQDKENFPQPTATAALKRSAAGMTRKVTPSIAFVSIANLTNACRGDWREWILHRQAL